MDFFSTNVNSFLHVWRGTVERSEAGEFLAVMAELVPFPCAVPVDDLLIGSIRTVVKDFADHRFCVVGDTALAVKVHQTDSAVSDFDDAVACFCHISFSYSPAVLYYVERGHPPLLD